MKTKAIPLSTDKPMPALLTVGQTALVLRGDESEASRKFVLRLVKSKQLRKGAGGGKKGSDIYIKASSIRELVA